MSLQTAYLFAMSGPIVGVICLPLVWWKPNVFGPLLAYVVMVTGVVGLVLMSIATP
jgi:predicted membrane protein